MADKRIQSTPDNSNLQGKQKKVWVIGSLSDRGFELLEVNCIMKKRYLTIIPRALMGSESGRVGYWLRGHEGENKKI